MLFCSYNIISFLFNQFGLIIEHRKSKVFYFSRLYVLRLMSSGDNMDMGKGYDDMIGCATCSLSQRLMQKVLLPCFILAVSLCFRPHVCLVVDL